MFDSEEIQHVLYRIGNAPIRDYPFPHFVVDGVFSPSFYNDLIESFPDTPAFTPISDSGRLTTVGDPARSVIGFKNKDAGSLPADRRAFWTPLLDLILSDDFSLFLLSKFDEQVRARFGNRLADARFGADLQIVNDSRQYQLDPHTDHPRKVVVLLIYVPRDDADVSLGTSFYIPKDPNFRCEGTSRHPRNAFTRVVTFPFKPNTAVGFFKSGRSFHGVERIKHVSGGRHLLQLSVEHGLHESSELARVPEN